ncbi:protein RADIALIS-like 2-like [Hibiscus syriacus]|uniref:Protein RADIALIS-like 2-like n=1 Tax=Hibiscus syriacus TaxID=106335 RepID=A0A6A2YBN9_HIBSY|nr:probable DNA-3-methyladenine glycosylase 2 [Hibiscus syriacus]KAE8675266.1 protein RADIALIS-like 2-like [Hibiscus syriacus]
MGEQTPAKPQPHPQSQAPNDSSSTPTQAQPQTLTEDPNNTSAAAVSSVTTVSTATVAPASTELVNVPLPSSSPPSKIPSRPRKIRKLSPDPNFYTNASQQGTSSSTSVREPPKTVGKASKTKLAQHRALAVVVPRIIARSLSCEGEVETAIRYLRNADPLLASLIDLHPPPTFDTFHTPFLALTRSILYQQLAFKAGTSIYTRFIALCGGENGVVPQTVISLTPQQLRQIGVSGRKASYLHDLARKYQTGILSDSAIVNMDDKSLFTMLTMVNGIGSWSVHMFMIFSLHRPDVLPINDLGIRKGVQMLYNLVELPRPSQMDQLCEKWRPYRSVASWYLWRFVEAKGTPSSAAAVAAGASLPPLQQQEEQQQHQQQPQLLDPINSILNLGACAWGQ